ncbi:DUF6385 domain-containing protein [Paenibacillus sp. GCM10023252]|uniref:DUF6385 domain-containing protein n=1 Tax=Paenibacillus sp. GCM10023252 TaxID=3252649 RepID=UPI0036155CAF
MRVPVTDQLLPLPAQDTSRAAVYSYAVINTGQHPVRVKLEITPNGTDYALDVEGIVAPGETEVIVPSKFLKYTRVAVCTTEPGQTAVLSVYYQAQLVR